jgi:hypothetical protein
MPAPWAPQRAKCSLATTRDSIVGCSSTELCGIQDEANRFGLGQRRDRIELTKVSTAFSCLGGEIGTEPIARPATQRPPALGGVKPRPNGSRAAGV